MVLSISRLAKRCARLAIDIIPSRVKAAALELAAIAPPLFKTKVFERTWSAIAGRLLRGSNEIWISNFGISSTLRCKLPLAKRQYVFGRPENLLSDRATLALIAELCRDCTDFLDVGANEGLFTFWANSRGPHGLRLHWFEPDRALHRRLAQNLAANSIQAMGNNLAVSIRSGTESFFVNLTDDSSGSLTSFFTLKHETAVESIDTISLAEYIQTQRIYDAIAKVDVEGAGEAVWRGVCEASHSIRYLIIEMIAPEIDCNLPSKIICEGNYYAYYINDFCLTSSVDGTYRYVPPFLNWFFCRLTPAELRTRLAGTPFRIVQTGKCDDAPEQSRGEGPVG